MSKPVSVAVVGSGPAGFYTAESLVKSDFVCEVDIIDRLPTPYGLIRGGVAPDHQTTKNVWRRYEKTALAEQVRLPSVISTRGYHGFRGGRPQIPKAAFALPVECAQARTVFWLTDRQIPGCIRDSGRSARAAVTSRLT